MCAPLTKLLVSWLMVAAPSLVFAQTRTVLILRDIDALSTKEVAEMLPCNLAVSRAPNFSLGDISAEPSDFNRPESRVLEGLRAPAARRLGGKTRTLTKAT